MTSFLSVVIVTALCLLIPGLRAYGVIGVAVFVNEVVASISHAALRFCGFSA